MGTRASSAGCAIECRNVPGTQSSLGERTHSPPNEPIRMCRRVQECAGMCGNVRFCAARRVAPVTEQTRSVVRPVRGSRAVATGVARVCRRKAGRAVDDLILAGCAGGCGGGTRGDCAAEILPSFMRTRRPEQETRVWDPAGFRPRLGRQATVGAGAAIEGGGPERARVRRVGGRAAWDVIGVVSGRPRAAWRGWRNWARGTDKGGRGG